MAQRIALFDNLKGIAILLVVLGHFVTRAQNGDASHMLQTVASYIYLFRMPLFLFASGLFAGLAWCKKRNAPVDKFLLYLLLYLIFMSAVSAVDSFISGHVDILNYFVVGSAPWFMLVLALFMLMVPVIGSMKPIVFLPMSIVVAVASGVYLDNSTTLSLSRAFVYLPYFALGFYLQPSNVMNLVSSIHEKIGPYFTKIMSISILILILVLFYFLPDDVLIYIKRLSSGMNLLTSISDSWGIALWVICLLRVIEYGVVVLVLALLILAIPQEHSVFTIWGERSFQIYIAHMFVMYYAIDAFNFYEILCPLFDLAVWTPFIFAPILTWLLSIPKFPNAWIKSLSSWCKKISSF